MKAILFLFPVTAFSLLLSGCNTIKGVGEDITGVASWTQEKMSGGGSGSSSTSSDADYVQNPPQFPKSSN